MKVIVPNKLELLSCSVPEDSEDGVEWNESSTYSKDARVQKDNISYSSLADDNTGNDPSETYSGEDAKWKKIGATSAYKMLDDYVETQTEAPAGETLSFSVPFNRATSFALLNMEGASVHITISDTDTEELFYDETFDLIKDIKHMSAFEYFFDLIEGVDMLVRTDIPMPILGTMTVELTAGSNVHQAKIGHVIVGRDRYIGMTKYDAEIGITDYSRKKTDEFGVTTLVRRSFAKHATLPLYFHPDDADGVVDIFQEVRATPCLFQGDNRDEGYGCLTAFGWLEDWRIVFSGPNEIEASVEVQGMI